MTWLRTLLICASLALPPAASAAPPDAAPAQASGTVVDYVNGVAQVMHRALEAVQQAFDRFEGSATEDEVHDTEARLKEDLTRASTEIVALPAWKGDAGLRDAMLQEIGAIEGVSAALTAWSTELRSRQVVTADVEATEGAFSGFREAMAASRVRVGEQVAAFAARNRMTVEVKEVTFTSIWDGFHFPSIVPPGSQLPDVTHVGLADMYRSGLIDRYNASSEAFTGVMDLLGKSGTAFGEARAAAVETLRANRAPVEAAGPWRDDDGLRASVLQTHDHLLSVLEGPMVEYAALRALPKPKNKDFLRIVQLRSEIEDLVDGVDHKQKMADQVFRKRWGILAAAEWAAAHPAP
jgi:hypothetical protein